MGTYTQLTLAEETTLADLETIVQRNCRVFVQVGNALAEIRFRRLYRATHATFESYCRERWGFKRRTAYAYLDAATVAENVHSSAQNPPSLTQARELAVLEPEQQREVAAAVDFSTTPVRKLKEHVAAQKIKGAASVVENVHSSAQSGDILPSATEEPRPEPVVGVRAGDLCQMCRERLFPQQAPKQDFPVDAEPTPDQTLVVEREYVAEDDVPEGLRRYQVDGEWALEGEL
jgi:hypothetical protein